MSTTPARTNIAAAGLDQLGNGEALTVRMWPRPRISAFVATSCYRTPVTPAQQRGTSW